jgi:hypothetical protein
MAARYRLSRSGSFSISILEGISELGINLRGVTECF